jgi:hypothetical protein
MPRPLPFRLNRSGVLLALISAGFAGEAAAAAGRVDFTTGGVTVAGRNGQQRPLARGAELDSGDTIRTGADGRAQIRFTDGSYVSLQPNTDFAISEYKYDGQADGSERGFYGLVRGAMRTVTGAIGRVNRNAYRVTTPTATVGIRGTGGVIQVLNDGSTLVIGTSGIWSLTNPAGSIDVPAGVSGLAPTEPNTPPRETNAQPQTSTAPVQPEQQVYTQGNNVTPEGTADLGTVVQPLVTGPGYQYGLAYGTSGNGTWLDGGEIAGTTTTATFNAAGQLTKIEGFQNTAILEGGTHAQFGTDGILAWGRWIGQVNIDCGECASNYTPNQGLHYVVGMPTPEMPIGGSATYNLYTVSVGGVNVSSATSPTYRDGSVPPGVFSGSLSVNFRPTAASSHSITGNFSVQMQDQTWAWSGSTSTFSAHFFMSTGTVTGCSSSCNAGVTGFFSGASAERAGVAYHVSGYNSAATPEFRDLVGAAALKKQ